MTTVHPPPPPQPLWTPTKTPTPTQKTMRITTAHHVQTHGHIDSNDPKPNDCHCITPLTPLRSIPKTKNETHDQQPKIEIIYHPIKNCHYSRGGGRMIGIGKHRDHCRRENRKCDIIVGLNAINVSKRRGEENIPKRTMKRPNWTADTPFPHVSKTCA